MELLCEKLSGDEQLIFMNAVHDMRSGNASLERFREAEICVMDAVTKYGKLLIIGDQLTVSIYNYKTTYLRSCFQLKPQTFLKFGV